MIDYLLLIKYKENLFEVGELLVTIFGCDDIFDDTGTANEQERDWAIQRLLELGETDVVKALEGGSLKDG